MFSIFRKNRSGGPDTENPGSMLPRRMELEERKAFRREMLDQVIRESLLALEAASSMYRFRVMPLDERHHRFIAVLDVARSFQPRQDGKPLSFDDIEALIRKNAFERFGLVLAGIYWRVSATEAAFEPGGPEGGATMTASSMDAAKRLHEAVEEARNARYSPATRHYQLVSEEEKQALMDAIRRGTDLPVLHVGELEYQSDMAPLDDGSRGRRRHDSGPD